MSQSKIFIDIGNSTVKWRTKESNVHYEGVDNFLSNSLTQADTAWVSAVANLHIVERFKSRFEKVNLVGTQSQFNNLKIAYEDSSNLGSDRFLAMLGAMSHFPKKPLLVIDLGSAMTFDVIDGNGLHQGGLIMPGLGVLRKSFPKFETTDLSTSVDGLATNTLDAWRSGTQSMLTSSIKVQVDKFNDIFSDGVVTMCGGIVNDIKSQLPKSIQLFDNLVLDGLECYSQTVG